MISMQLFVQLFFINFGVGVGGVGVVRFSPRSMGLSPLLWPINPHRDLLNWWIPRLPWPRWRARPVSLDLLQRKVLWRFRSRDGAWSTQSGGDLVQDNHLEPFKWATLHSGCWRHPWNEPSNSPDWLHTCERVAQNSCASTLWAVCCKCPLLLGLDREAPNPWKLWPDPKGFF